MPLSNGNNGPGRDDSGRFASGNRCAVGRGNPEAARVHAIRKRLLSSVKLRDIERVVKKLVRMAKGGNLHAMELLFDRLLGKPVEADLIERIAVLERTVDVDAGEEG